VTNTLNLVAVGPQEIIIKDVKMKNSAATKVHETFNKTSFRNRIIIRIQI